MNINLSPHHIISSFLSVYYGRISIRPYQSFLHFLLFIMGEYQFAPTDHFGRISIRPYQSFLHFLLFIMGEYPFAPTDHPLVASSLFFNKKRETIKASLFNIHWIMNYPSFTTSKFTVAVTSLCNFTLAS